jgi:hypothetical protein
LIEHLGLEQGQSHGRQYKRGRIRFEAAVRMLPESPPMRKLLISKQYRAGVSLSELFGVNVSALFGVCTLDCGLDFQLLRAGEEANPEQSCECRPSCG